ncbi:MAG: hypothetical protein KH230_16950 [Enterocloster asparagiformis]|nr:hypothetical protein [Enterocloster asparagiformis]
MKTNRQKAMEFADTYREYKKVEEEKQKVWYALLDKWEKGSYADHELGDQVEAASKEYSEIREKTSICARMVVDYILKDQEGNR